MTTTSDPVRVAMVGGGEGSMIGPVHLAGLSATGRAKLVAGAFSRDADRNARSGERYGVSAERVYADYQALLAAEGPRSPEERAQVLLVTTPNNSHAAIAIAAAQAGLHVLCEKPLTATHAQAKDLVAAVEDTGIVLGVAHTYTGHPMVRRARELIARGTLGKIQAIRGTYLQGWLREPEERGDNPQAAWRTDPAVSGLCGAFGDIGSHVFNLIRYVTQCVPTGVSSRLETYVQGRTLDDYGHAVVKMEGGALATMTASQVSHGRGNELELHIDGTKAGLSWVLADSLRLRLRRNDAEDEILEAPPQDTLKLESDASWGDAIPVTSVQAFAALYQDMFDAIAGASPPRGAGQSTFPNVYDGEEVMRFLHLAVQSSSQGGAWVPWDAP